MTPRRHLEVKGWKRFQHYAKRRPVWIKLYTDLVDDYDFQRLPDASKGHLMAIWLLAARLDNRIPNDAAWVGQRIGANTPVDLAGLVAAGFLRPRKSDGRFASKATVSHKTTVDPVENPADPRGSAVSGRKRPPHRESAGKPHHLGVSGNPASELLAQRQREREIDTTLISSSASSPSQTGAAPLARCEAAAPPGEGSENERPAPPMREVPPEKLERLAAKQAELDRAALRLGARMSGGMPA